MSNHQEKVDGAMPPTSDGIKTVGCSLSNLIPDVQHLNAIQGAVLTVHKCTILATELLNMHLRRYLNAECNTGLKCFFNASWILNAYNEVTNGEKKVNVVHCLRETRDQCMPPFVPPNRRGIQQCLLYDARNLATVAATGVWMHFKPRILSHVKRLHAIDKDAYNALSKEEKRKRKLTLMQMASDVCRIPSEEYQSPCETHAWVNAERERLGIDKAVGKWNMKPLLYHLKEKPHCFLKCMHIMSTEREASGASAFSLYPLRRTFVPRHIRFDQKAIRDLLRLGNSDYIKQRAKEGSRKRKANELELPPLGNEGGGTCATPKRRSKEEMREENEALFQSVVDLRSANVQRRQLFDYAFTTDGVCARVQMRTIKKNKGGALQSLPRRGIWAINELKRVSRLDEMKVVGIDPGKRELVVGVDMDNPLGGTVRYTQKQRLRDIRSRQYADESKRTKPFGVEDAEAKLSGYNSRSTDLRVFCAYCGQRHAMMDECLAFYSQMEHRKRRWKTAIKSQKSEERLFQKIEALKTKGKQVVLAYGSWGMVAGRPGTACNKGNPPCLGVGLMKKLSRRFVVAPTPEAYTSKTCCKCFGECGPWKEFENDKKKRIRGLRRCTQRDCMLVLNRDKNGATNIGTNFMRLMENKPLIRSLTDEDLSFHRASLCTQCD